MATQRFLAPDASGAPKSTAGAVTSTPDAIVALDGTGKLDSSVLPVGVGLVAQSLPQTGALAAGDKVNIYDATGTATARKADASAGTGKLSQGFVIAATSAPGPALVFGVGMENTALTGLTPGEQYFLSDATPGAITTTAPTASGSVVEYVGVAVSATKLVFEPDVRYVN